MCSNLALYAKWTPKFHNVRIVLQKKEDGNYTQEDSVIWKEDQQVEFLKVLHGKIVFSDNEDKIPPIPDNGLYKFLGWFYMDDGVELMWDFEHHPIVKDTVIYAKWSSEVMVPYTVYYVDQNGNQIAPPLNSSSLAGHSVTLNAKIGNELNEGYRDGYFPQIVSHSIELAIENAETGVEYTFVYEQAEIKRYYVHYIDAVTGSELITTKTATTGLAIVTEKHEYVKDYVPDEYQKPLVISADETKNHIYFYYTKAENEGVWFVGHYVQDKDEPDKYNEHAPIGDIGAIGDNIQATWPVDLSKDGYVFKEATINDGTTTKTVYSIEQAKGAITAKGLEIKVYYDRIKYPYMIEYINKDTGAHIYESAVFSGEDCEPYGKTVGAVSIPTIIGYEYASSTTCTIVKDGPDNIQKNIIRVYYTEQTIRINFEVIGPEGCGTVNPPYTSVKYASDLSASATAVPSANYTFVGWFYDEDCKVPIVANSLVVPSGKTLMLRKPDDGWAPVTYYAKFEPSISDLTIQRENAESGQVYVYEIKNTDTDDVYYATIVGNGQVTIKGLPVGNYSVVQQNDWSWRYEDSVQIIEHDNTGSNVTFGADATSDQWLNGNSENKKNTKE